MGLDLRVIQRDHLGLDGRRPVVGRLKQVHESGVSVEDTPELVRLEDGPHQRAGWHAQMVLQLVHQVQRVTALPIHLVHEGEDGDATQLADPEELLGLGLNSLGGVDEHHRAVRRGQRPVGVFAEVLVARCVQDVDATVLVVELHHR